MKSLFRFAAVLLVLGSVMAHAQSTDPFRVVGYYSMSSALAGKEKVPFKYLTHVNLWFLNPDSVGHFTRDLGALRDFIDRAHKKHVKVLFAIGGGTRQPQYHRLLQDDLRGTLIQNLVAEVQKYNLDGVDVDLEGTDIDGNYEAFVTELAQALHAKQKLITAAIAVYYKDQFTDKALAQYDFVNVMSYDRTGPWQPEKPGPHATYANAVEDLDYFGIERKIAAQRMNLGVPFYGYGYGPELTSPATSKNYKDIVAAFPGAENTDEWKMANGHILYYNGVPTIRLKTQLARTKASGIMIWELRGDSKGKKSLLKNIHTASKTKA
jgi:chitinase